MGKYKAWCKEQLGHSMDSMEGMANSTIINKEMLLVGMSANVTDEELASAFFRGMHFFVPKPPQLDTLVAILKIKKDAKDLDAAIDEIGQQAAIKPGGGGTFSLLRVASWSRTASGKRSSAHIVPAFGNVGCLDTLTEGSLRIKTDT